jgi:hypothetical protein
VHSSIFPSQPSILSFSSLLVCKTHH